MSNEQWFYTYKYQNPTRNKKDIKVLSTHVHQILVSKNCHEEKMVCHHRIFIDRVKNLHEINMLSDFPINILLGRKDFSGIVNTREILLART